VAVWAKWSESRTESQQLRAELKSVYVEAETLRTQANQAQQQVALLEQQVRSLTAERTEILRRLEAAGGEQPPPVKAKPTKSPARKRPAPSRLPR
jgi:predicted  nucleic acid-binding Zn-ribbon protein